MCRPRIARPSARRGSTLAEFAVVLASATLVLCALADFSRLMAVQAKMTALAREGAVAIVAGVPPRVVEGSLRANCGLPQPGTLQMSASRLRTDCAGSCTWSVLPARAVPGDRGDGALVRVGIEYRHRPLVPGVSRFMMDAWHGEAAGYRTVRAAAVAQVPGDA